MAETLYADPTRTRFYLVPDNANLPGGSLLLRSMTGARFEVDPDVVAVFEIAEGEAKEHARASLDQVLKQARTFLEGHGVAAKEPEAVIAGLGSAGTALLDGLRDALASDQPLKDPGLQDLRGKVRDVLQDPLLAERIRKATKDIQKATADLKRTKDDDEK